MLRTSFWILQQCQNVFQRTYWYNIGLTTCTTTYKLVLGGSPILRHGKYLEKISRYSVVPRQYFRYYLNRLVCWHNLQNLGGRPPRRKVSSKLSQCFPLLIAVILRWCLSVCRPSIASVKENQHCASSTNNCFVVIC